jgi:predicted nucleic acid-binding protein
MPSVQIKDVPEETHATVRRRAAEAHRDLRDNLTIDDAAYVALAEALGTTFLTADARFADAPGLRCPVETLGSKGD